MTPNEKGEHQANARLMRPFFTACAVWSLSF
ncbi:hypothetical protein SAMN05519105_2288 [Rhodobacter sp. 24-YEA-8]|nr:hypothetical protein SAMN05519105_2288 [Rhodobacter sp. 24-YEA-8]